MKFKNVKTGAILEPNSKFTEEQMEKSEIYEKVTDNKKSSKETEKVTDNKKLEE